MKTFKIGNKATCIVRSFSSGEIGQIYMEYGNQPYTILQEVNANIRFNAQSSSGGGVNKEFLYNVDQLNSITLSNINLTEKILNLIYSKSQEFFIHHVEKRISDDNNQVFLSSQETKYQIFAYDESEQLETALGVLEDSNILTVGKPNHNYLIVYSCLGERGYSLQRPQNIYLTLDLQIDGSDQLNQRVTY